MKRLLYIVLVAALAVSCTKDLTEDAPLPNFGDGFIEIPFGHSSFEEINIETRAELPALIESRVTNLYVLIFNDKGQRIYGSFFDSDSRVMSDTELTNRDESCWWVENLDPSKDSNGNFSNKDEALRGYTHGKIRMRAPDVNGGKMYVIANIDPDMINISSGELDLTQTEAELKAMIGIFNQQSTSRTGLFLMTASTTVTISDKGKTYQFSGGSYEQSQDATKGYRIMLDRLDAKVTVKVGVLPGYLTVKDATRADGSLIYETDENGNPTTTPVKSRQEIESFTPTSWQAVNLPKGAYLVPQDTDAPTDKTGGYWNSNVSVFEMLAAMQPVSFINSDGTSVDTEREVHRFVFYMLENRQSANKKASVTSEEAKKKYMEDADGNPTGVKPYHLRDKQYKQEAADDKNGVKAGEYRVWVDSEGNVIDGDQWEFAPEDGTYIIIKGEVQMKVKDSDSYAAQTMNALVTYYIHLGAFGKQTSAGSGDYAAEAGLDNYDICRNTHYTYTINVKGVRQIEVEVETDAKGWTDTNENQAGNMGDVYLAQESIYTFDAHYGQRVFRFNADAIMRTAEADLLTWYVASPFGRTGSPERVGPSNVEVPTGLDYKWVHFMLNRSDGTISLTENDDAKKLEGNFTTFADFHTGTDTPSGQQAYVADPESPDRYFQYSQKGQWYPGDGNEKLLDVMQLCALLREQVKLYKEDRDPANYDKATGKYLNGYKKQSLFDEPLRNADGSIIMIETPFTDAAGETIRVPKYAGGNIYITAFVDEFYYDLHPITGNETPDLWRNFVYTRDNQMRMMHILCDAKISADNSSTATGSVVTIRQRPIQTIYEPNKQAILDMEGIPLPEAWGLESIDETRQESTANNCFYFYNFMGSADKSSSSNDHPSDGYSNGSSYGTSDITPSETSSVNGRLNTALLWSLKGTDGTVSTTTDPYRRWDTYLDYVRANDHVFTYTTGSGTGTGTTTRTKVTHFLKDDPTIANMRYTCMMRNRDNDGDGVIDDDEIRWYLASTDQLLQMFVADLGLSSDSQLYNTFDILNNSRISHVVSSTMTERSGYTVQEMVWAEEGCSTSAYRLWDNSSSRVPRYSIRCVRNLGHATYNYGLFNKEDYPPSPIVVTPPATIDRNAVYDFDLRNMNHNSKRDYTASHDLTPMDELAETSTAYHRFKTGDYIDLPGEYGYIYTTLNQGIPICPTDYRVANLREMAAIYTSINNEARGDKLWWGTNDGTSTGETLYYLVCNYYAFGDYGDGSYAGKLSWSTRLGHTTVNDVNSNRVRCVMDIEVKK